MSVLVASSYAVSSISTFILTSIVLYYILSGRGSRIDIGWLIEGMFNCLIQNK